MHISSILSAPITYFKSHVLGSLTPIQKRVVLVAAAVLSSLTLAWLAYRHCFKREENRDLVMDKRDSSKEVERKVASEYPTSVLNGGQTYLYLDATTIERGKFIKDETYREIVENLTIVCVDTFIFDRVNKTYLLVKRNDPPAQGFWWLPGGRLTKGESELLASERLCKREVGLEVIAQKVLTISRTIFPDSMWTKQNSTERCQTDTLNYVVFAILNQQSTPNLDETCDKYQWCAIDDKPTDQDPYVKNAHALALEFIRTA